MTAGNAQVKLIDAFKKNGHELYVVGGCVRDARMGIMPKDYDYTTKATPDMIKTILRGTKGVTALWDQGEKFGTIAAKIDGATVEITTFRAEEYEQGSRKPKVIFGDSIVDDLGRRDFTMNAMAVCLTTNGPLVMVDPYGGREDMDNRTIRFVGNAADRILDDPLRMLRAVRFSAQLDFTIDSGAVETIRMYSNRILTISQERIAEELVKMLMTDSPAYAVRMMDACDLLHYVLPEIKRLQFVEQDKRWHSGDVFMHTMEVLYNSQKSLDQRLAALFHDSGKFETQVRWPDGRITFYNHEKMSGAIASKAMRRLKFPNAIRHRVVQMCRLHMRPLGLYNNKFTSKSVRKFVRDCADNSCGITVDDVMRLHYADVLAHKHPQVGMYQMLRKAVDHERAQTPEESWVSPLDGNEIIEMHPELEPGAWVGSIKSYLTNEVVCGRLDPNDKETARELAQQVTITARMKS